MHSPPSGRRAPWSADRSPLDWRLDDLGDLAAANARGSEPPCPVRLAHTRRSLTGRGLKDAKRHRYYRAACIDGELDDDAIRPTAARAHQWSWPIGRGTRECCRLGNLELIEHAHNRTTLLGWGLNHTRLLRLLNQTSLQECE